MNLELAMAVRVSMEEERSRQEKVTAAEGGSQVEKTGDGDDGALSAAAEGTAPIGAPCISKTPPREIIYNEEDVSPLALTQKPSPHIAKPTSHFWQSILKSRRQRNVRARRKRNKINETHLL